ncbi:MAG TPA: hypothetical protein PKC97_13340 [Burkholderiaceae bacterium]|nr:hypothetical protein [Burkholderiaceae bacterium]
MSVATARGAKRGGSAWEYHSRSDHHSKLACWALMFDLLLECDVLRKAAADGRIAFAVNHVMVGPINKTLDMVLTLVDPKRSRAGSETFAAMATELSIVLSDEDRAALQELPPVRVERKDDVSEVAIALEAKACMTEHVKSIPRLHAEILATGYLARKAAPHCITVSFTLVNAAQTFRSPGTSGKVTQHKQPADAVRVIEMISHAVPRREELGGYGYDVIGVTVIDCRNDGSSVSVATSAPFPRSDSHVHYDRMVRSICSEFRRRYAATMV